MPNDRHKPQRTAHTTQLWEVRAILGLLVFGIIATLVLGLTGWDLAISARYYVPGGAHDGWAFSRDQPWKLLYYYGEYPPVILALAALWLYRAAQSEKVNRLYAKPCLVVILTMVLGPALLVNGILKHDWGRPRPADITAFGGSSPYHQVWQPGTPGGGKSFTCGHCSAGFAMVSAASVGVMHPVLGAVAFAGGLVYGTLLGTARIIQGGHFVTDVIWSAVLVLALAAGLHALVFRVPGVISEDQQPFPLLPNDSSRPSLQSQQCQTEPGSKPSPGSKELDGGTA
jgi:membrane-associated PAP2 superfamily phosphatase